MEYLATGGMIVTGLRGAYCQIFGNPARYQNFKFYLGEWCGVPGSNILQKIVRVSFDGSRVIYTVVSPSGVQTDYLEQACLTETEMRYAQIQANNISAANAIAKLDRLFSLGG